MRKINTIGVDLAKNVIQVTVVSGSNRELSNKSCSRKKFADFLARQKPSLVAFEACGTAHHWGRFAQSHGHEVLIIPAKIVASYRQGHKTDANDALAVVEAAGRPDLKVAPLKSVEQQGMQSIQRSRKLLVQNRVALSNHVRGLLLEFGIVIPQGWAALHRRIPEILEDGDNGLPDLYRPTLHLLWRRLCELRDDIQQLDAAIKLQVKQHAACKELLALEGIGPIGAILLYATLGSGEAFSSAREFAAYLGLTPKQHSSAGKVKLIGISKAAANKRLRAILIQGARAYVHRLKEPKSSKDRWLKELIERAGTGKAAVALAHKNARTAWAMLTRGESYELNYEHRQLAA